MKSKLIIVEGPQGGGKTSVTNYLREKITSSILLRLSGTKEADANIVHDYHMSVLEMIEKCEPAKLTFILDRSHFTEAAYCYLGYKPYSFVTQLESLNAKLLELNEKYDVILVLLTANESTFEKRLKRDKPDYEYAPFDVTKSLNQVTAYTKLFEVLEGITSVVLDTSELTLEEVQELVLAKVK